MESPKLKDIFLAALEIPNPAARLVYVDSACGTDIELRNCVRDMLVAHQKAQTPIPEVPEGPTQPETTPRAHAAATLPPGTIIDQRYKIIELIAEGGMGSVYRACRVSDMKMEVAIKLVKQGMASQQILARFNIERQALAIMKHDNIAKVLDAGTTAEGHPYFVMELVKGLPITKFCDDNKLTVNERLELFEKVCSAVQHAHQKGIVHRDLKPSNILVGLYDDKAVPKVIDFGLAKAIYQPITDDILHTKFGTFVGTWQYTAPEQAILNNLDIDTRADIYSLGVILYELLTGNPPIEKSRITHAVMEEVLRIIREEEPPKPSTKIHSSDERPSIAALRRSEPLQLERQVRGELDWIVMRALEKDRNRRFATASELGEDIRRYLAGEAVLSGPVTWQYRLKKFVRKNRGAVIAASLILTAITIGAVVSTVGWVTAHRQQVRADENAEIAQAVNDFLRIDLLSEADPGVQIKPDQQFVSDITVIKALDRASKKVSGRFAMKPLIEAAIRQTIGNSYFGLGEFEKARIELERSEQLYREHYGTKNAARLSSFHDLGVVLMYQSNFSKSKAILEESLELRKQVLGASSADTLKNQYHLGLIHSNLSEHSRAVDLFSKTLEMQKANFGIDNCDTLLTQRDLASELVELNDYANALRMLNEVVDKLPILKGANHPEVLSSMNTKAYCLGLMKNYVEAEAIMQRVIADSEKTLGHMHPSTLSYRYNYAATVVEQLQSKMDRVKLDQAISSLKEIVDRMKQVCGIRGFSTLAAIHCYGVCLAMDGKNKEAEALFLDAYDGCRNAFGLSNEKTILVLEFVVAHYDKVGDKDKFMKYQALLNEARKT